MGETEQRYDAHNEIMKQILSADYLSDSSSKEKKSFRSNSSHYYSSSSESNSSNQSKEKEDEIKSDEIKQPKSSKFADKMRRAKMKILALSKFTKAKRKLSDETKKSRMQKFISAVRKYHIAKKNLAFNPDTVKSRVFEDPKPKEVDEPIEIEQEKKMQKKKKPDDHKMKS